MKNFEVAVIGGGLAGMVAAVAIARGGRNVALIAPPAAREDRRTTALKRLSENRLPAIPHHYQPAVRDAEAGKGYSWRRQAKPAA